MRHRRQRPTRYPISRSLLPLAQRIAPEVDTVDREQVEGQQLHLGIMFARHRAIEVGEAIAVQPDRLAIEDEGRRPEPLGGLADRGYLSDQ